MKKASIVRGLILLIVGWFLGGAAQVLPPSTAANLFTILANILIIGGFAEVVGVGVWKIVHFFRKKKAAGKSD